MKTTSTTAPSPVEIAYNAFRQKIYIINFNIVPPREGESEFEYDSLEVPPGQFSYDHLVSLLIRYRYSSDRMEAIQNNYLATQGLSFTQKGAEYEQEFAEMQAWRETAKDIAREVMRAAGL